MLIIATIFSGSFGFDLKCEDVDLKTCESFRCCIVNDLVITSPYDTITSVNGNTDPSDYYSLIIRNQTVKFVPGNIASFFPQLEELEISNSNLEWIEQENIKELTNLKTLNLEKNKLGILEEGLFDFHTKLETITIRDNKLNFVHEYIVHHLTNLRIFDIENTECATHIFNSCTIFLWSEFKENCKQAYDYRDFIRDRLYSYCQSWEDAYKIYKRHVDEKRNNLQLKKDDSIWVTRRLKSCDSNLDAALANFRQQKLISSDMTEFIDKPNDSLVIDIFCPGGLECLVREFKVSFANLSIESEKYKDVEIRILHIHQQPTLFLPQNLAEHFPHLNDLRVIECGLYEVDFSVFEGLDLFNLNLTKNKIRDVPVNTFADLANLHELDLSFNKIHMLHDDVFVSLKSLQKLCLNNNYLTSITVELLRNLENVRSLFLQENQLKFIGATLLTPLTSLELVDLSGNVCINMSRPASSLIDIEEIIIDNCIVPVVLNCKMSRNETNENGGIDNHCQIEYLFIEYPKTKISKLNVGGVDGLNNSVKVFFAENQSMKFFPFQLSHHLPNLERIEIQQSKLTALYRMDFAGFTNLTEIVINENNLSSISQGSFDTNFQLELLDLSSNNIVALPMRIFAKLTRLHTLLLAHNRIVRFTASLLPRKNLIDTFRVNNNRLEFIETKTIRFLRNAKLIDLTGNVCIDIKFARTEKSTRELVELSGEIDLNCSVDDLDE